MIDYSLIDEQCIDMVQFFNMIGLKTEFSCQGHDGDRFDASYEIIFDGSVDDCQIEKFINIFNSQYSHSPFIGMFSKWKRKVAGDIRDNWMYHVAGKNATISHEFAQQDLDTFREGYDKYFMRGDCNAQL